MIDQVTEACLLIKTDEVSISEMDTLLTLIPDMAFN